MKPLTQTRRSDAARKGSNGQKPKSMFLMALLIPLLLGMTVAVFGQNRRYFTPAEYAQPLDPFPLREMARRYGVGEALEMYFQLQREEEARREMEQVREAQRRDRELRKKVVELVNTSYKLHQRLSNPSVIHADAPELARTCEKLAKAIKKLMR
ncbi:hypothetical protein MYX78_13790 [Acidobacteria bacterium AH-259-G07]|nr:hypothetical protein [Acidobacteria bacterium AH-259-G07]